MALHISISAEPIVHVGPLAITNSIFTSVLVSALLIAVAYSFHHSKKSINKPTGLQNILELLVEAFQNLGNSITGNAQKTAIIMPIPFAAFCWILLNNWFGLLPGVGTIGFIEEPKQEVHEQVRSNLAVYATQTIPIEHGLTQSEPPIEEEVETITADETHEEVADESEENSHQGPKFVPIFRPGTADLNTTLALALMSVGATQFYGLKVLGKDYLKKFFNLNGIFSFVGILELVSEISKIMSFAFRLFGNIFAGEVLLSVIAFLIPVVVPMPFIGLELFVGVIQALVFSMLTIVFMNMAMMAHGDEH